MATLLEDARKALRLSTDAFDGEITDLIDACKADLALVGVSLLDVEDPLVKRAILLYVKAHFGYEDPNDKFMRNFKLQKLALRDSAKYTDAVL